MIDIVSWTADARADLRELTSYLAEYDPRVARRAATRFFNAANRLAELPAMGRPGAEPGTRELSISNWKRVMIYRIMNDRVEVLALRDPRRKSNDEITAG